MGKIDPWFLIPSTKTLIAHLFVVLDHENTLQKLYFAPPTQKYKILPREFIKNLNKQDPQELRKIYNYTKPIATLLFLTFEFFWELYKIKARPK